MSHCAAAVQLGDGTTLNKFVVPSTDILSDSVGITAGVAHACSLSMSGVLKCWGYNALGQLGLGNTITSVSPAIVSTAGVVITAIAAGDTFTCVQTSVMRV